MNVTTILMKIFTMNFKERYNKIFRDYGVGKALKGHIVVVLNENKTILIPLEKADI